MPVILVLEDPDPEWPGKGKWDPYHNCSASTPLGCARIRNFVPVTVCLVVEDLDP